MRNEITSIVAGIREVLHGEPWFGRSVFSILDEIHPALVFKKPNGDDAHSLIELLYHMNTWAEFTLRRIRKAQEPEVDTTEARDWRQIDPLEHTWAKGLEELRSLHDQIISSLSEKEDEFLDEKVEYREYNFRFLLNGLIQHNVYHLGQIAYVKKWLIPD